MRRQLYVGMIASFAGGMLAGVQPASACPAPSTQGAWTDYTHLQAYEIAISNTKPMNLVDNPPGDGILCVLHVQQTFIQCFSPTGDRHNPGVNPVFALANAGAVKFDDSPSHIITSFTIRAVDGVGYWIYVLRADNQIYARFVGLPVASGDSFQWGHIAVSPSTLIARQIQWADTRGLMMVGTDNHVYWRGGGVWNLFTSTPAVAIWGGDDSTFLTLNGTTGTATQLSAVYGPQIGGDPVPPAVGASPLFSLALAQSNPDRAFSLGGRSTAVSCDALLCFALEGSSTPLACNQEPAIYWTFQNGGFTDWHLWDTDFNPIFGSAQPHTVYTGTSFRGIIGDVFVAQGNGHYLEWIPSF